MHKLVGDTVLRLSGISRKAAEIRNSLTSINQLPTEMIVLIATVFAKQRDLVNATAVCRCWRTILLSSPRLWYNAGGSSSEIQAYIERSGSMPTVVNLPSRELAEFVAPYISRLISLALRVGDSRSSFRQIAEHLRHPIPTLHTLHISNGAPKLHAVEFVSDVCDAFFTHLKKLELDGILSFRGPKVVPDSFKPFPEVTEIALHVEKRNLIEIPGLLDTLKRLPVLERVSITLGSNWRPGPPQTITLPHAREMAILVLERHSSVPPIFGLIKLPNLTLLRLQDMSALWEIYHPIFPTSPFGKHLPSLTNLPDLRVSIIRRLNLPSGILGRCSADSQLGHSGSIALAGQSGAPSLSIPCGG